MQDELIGDTPPKLEIHVSRDYGWIASCNMFSNDIFNALFLEIPLERHDPEFMRRNAGHVSPQVFGIAPSPSVCLRRRLLLYAGLLDKVERIAI